MCACVVAHTYHTEALLLKKSFAFVLLRFYSHAFVGTNQAGVGADGKPMLTYGAAVTGLTAANLYIAAFGVSWGPVMWVLLGEMFPNRMRGAALAVSGATNWAANFAVTVTFLPLLNAVGLSGAYGLYTVAAVLSVPFVWAAVRETKG